jgi:hypothetical protein
LSPPHRGRVESEGSYDLPVGTVDVILVPDERQAKQDVHAEVGIFLDGVFTEFASGEFLASNALNLAGRQGSTARTQGRRRS